MVQPFQIGGVAASAAACVLAGALTAACAGAAPPAGAAERAAARVLVKLVRASDDAGAIAAEATRVAGVPVRHAAAAGGGWHSLALQCEGAAACDAAIARLRAARSLYQAVEIDGRKTAS